MKLALLLVVLSLGTVACSNSNGVQENASQRANELAEQNGNTSEDYDQCPIGASYDETEEFCYIECHGLSDEECETLENDVFGDFDEFYVDDYSRKNEDGESIAQYAIEDDLSLSELENTEPGSDELFRHIWRDAKLILPDAWVSESFSEFHINTDGEEGTLAYVQNDEYNEGQWVIAFDDLDYAGLDDKEFIHTVIHEFGHVVFLGSDQLNSDAAEGCKNFSVEEGCANSHSHINRFYQTFWTELIDENTATNADEDLLLEFYKRYQDRFVSEYAATDPIEDAAEVFTNFVLRDKPSDVHSIANQKIGFMHTVEPLVKLRTQIRGKLALIRKHRD